MRVPWDEIREEAIRAAAREEASKIVEGALNGLHDKLTAMWGVEADVVRAGLLYGIMGAVRDTVREIKTLGYGAEPHKPVSGPVRTAPGPVDYLPLACGDSACTQAHGTNGQHTGELGSHG